MLKSLWSGVSGLQAHQVAMDVESNNIANVNTVGYKYSRANFSDMLSVTTEIASAPNGSMGGSNGTSVGLGTGISSTTKIFKQGSLQSTDKTTDVALQGDGFFVVSGNGGVSNYYTRAGDFVFDANGSLVDNNGYVVQGWTKDIVSTDDTCETEDSLMKVDSTGSISGIQINPGLVMPAQKTSEVSVKANLNSGSTIEQMSCVYQLDSTGTISEDTEYDSDGNVIQQAENFGVLYNDEGEAFNLADQQGIWVSYAPSTITSGAVGAGAVGDATIELNGETIAITLDDAAATAADNASSIAAAINTNSNLTGVTASVIGDTVQLVNLNDDSSANVKNITLGAGTVAGSSFTAGDEDITAYQYNYTTSPSADSTAHQFTSTEELRALMQQDANIVKDGAYDPATATVSVELSSSGRYQITNVDDGDTNSEPLTIAVTSYFDSDTSENVLFTQTFEAMNTSLAETTDGTVSTSGVINAAVHGTSIDVYDSLGTKHDLQITFRKTGVNEWSWSAEVPSPGTLLGGSDAKSNSLEGGSVTFNSDGSLQGFNPPTLTFTPNNGASSSQQITLDFGDNGTFNGLTGNDAVSTTSAISQNGYSSGDLSSLQFDASGKVIGNFTNGRSIALAQVAISTFANNAGLQSEGSNLFSATSNSGDATVGTAGTGGRAEVAASMLETSNVDLSESLTQLIVVQRGFQANSKTITTSDQMLNTLLQLKQ